MKKVKIGENVNDGENGETALETVQNGAKRQKCVLSGYPRSSLEFFTSKNVADFQLVVLLQLASCEYVRRLFATRLEKPLTEVSAAVLLIRITRCY